MNSQASDSRPERSPEAQGDKPGTAPSLAGEIVPSDVLMSGRRQMFISHGGDVYRLCVTSKGRLILTK